MRQEGVSKGKWYLYVSCKGCSRPLYLIDDPHNGTALHQFVGGGKISTPCPRCHKDTTYDPHEISCIQADEDIAARRPPRVEPSNMPRQPITTRYPNVKVTFGPGLLENRPKAAALVARCVALWTEVERQQALLLAEMLQANTKPAIALFLTIQNSRIQAAVLDAVAKIVLNSADEYELFSALMSYAKSLEKERNALAHGCFGGADQITDGVAWIDPIALTTIQVDSGVAGAPRADETQSALLRKSFVYELGDLETIAQDMEDLADQIGYFSGYLFSYREAAPDGPSWRAARFPQLCAAPRIAQELSRLREGQQKTP